MTAKAIVNGKMWGIMGASYWYLVAYAAPAVALSVLSGPLGFAYTVFWMAATVLAMYLIGAAGLALRPGDPEGPLPAPPPTGPPTPPPATPPSPSRVPPRAALAGARPTVSGPPPTGSKHAPRRSRASCATLPHSCKRA